MSLLQAEGFWKSLKLLFILQTVLSVVLLALAGFSAQQSVGWSPRVVSATSINLIVVSCVALLSAILFLRLSQRHSFYGLTMVLANVYCLLHLLVAVAYGATYLPKLSLSDPWVTHGDVCYYFLSSDAGPRCTVDKTYIAAFAFAWLNALLSAAIIAISVICRPEPFHPSRASYRRFFRDVFSTTHNEAELEVSSAPLEAGPGSQAAPKIESGQGEANITQEIPAEVDATRPAPVRTFWENGVWYQVIPMPGPRPPP